jgi:dTDP-4-amino-4,6-dideoxygalactose transaminase
MLEAISRYGPRVLPNTQQIISQCRNRGELVCGPQIQEFEDRFTQLMGGGHSISASYGRMAFYYILKAMELPPGSEVIFPALTFWVVPEIARAIGLKPVFVDIDPDTFNMDASLLETAVSSATRAIVPTHLYGLPCDMDPILSVARRHNLRVIEDCAHALGATYHARPVGTFGDASLFSFQTLKPLNTYGGGMAWVRNRNLAGRVRALAAVEPWPDERRVMHRLRVGRLQRIFTRPRVFSCSAFPILWAASFFKARPDVYLWESIRPLNPLPASYTERYSNVQAALGLAGLDRLNQDTQANQAHARIMGEMLRDLPGVRVPKVPAGCSHVYYQQCVYVPDRDELVRRCIRAGIDVETLHVDVCPQIHQLFGRPQTTFARAERAAQTIQIPIYASLSDLQVRRIATKVRQILQTLHPQPSAAQELSHQ